MPAHGKDFISLFAHARRLVAKNAPDEARATPAAELLFLLGGRGFLAWLQSIWMGSFEWTCLSPGVGFLYALLLFLRTARSRARP